MFSWTALIGLWLIDIYVLSTVLLVAVLGSTLFIQRPIRRMAVAWVALGGLATIAVLCSVPGWPRMYLLAITGEPDVSTERVVFDQVRRISAAENDRRDAAANRKLDDTRSPHISESLVPAEHVAPISATAESLSPLTGFPVFLQESATTVFYGFSAGCAFVAIWLVWGTVQSSRIARSAIVAPKPLRDELVRIVGSERSCPRLLVSRLISSPIAMGARRPIILLPTEIADQQEEGHVRAILAHEWAHIEHKDLWMLGISRWLLLVLFAHPLFWWLRARIRDDQETLAATVAAADSSRADYAAQLLTWARLSSGKQATLPSTALGVWERRSGLSRRIEQLLDDAFHVETTCSQIWKAAAIAAIAVCSILLSVVTVRPGPPSFVRQAEEQFNSPDIAQTATADVVSNDGNADRVRQKLNEKTSVALIEQRLAEAIPLVLEPHGLRTHFNERALKKLGINTSARISCQLSEISLKSALTLILEPLELCWEIHDGAISIMTAEKRTIEVVRATIEFGGVLEKLYPDKNWDEAKSEIRRSILSCIEPGSWKDSGGLGSATWEHEGLVVENTRNVHMQIRNLERLLEFSVVNHLSLSATTSDAPVHSALETVLGEPTFVNVDLEPLLDFYRVLHGINILVDQQAIQKAGDRFYEPVKSDGNGIPMADVLDIALEPLDMDYIVEHEVLKITSREVAATLLETHAYDVERLVGKQVDRKALVAFVTDSVDPDSWSENGGAGRISELPGYLLVYQTQRGHREISNQLELWKKRLSEKEERTVNEP